MAYTPTTTGLYTLAELEAANAGHGVHPNTVHSIIDAMPLFDQAPLLACNDGSMNKTEIITEYPDLQARAYNEGVEAVKSQSNIVVDSTAMFAAYSVIDADMMKRNGNSAKWRANKEAAFTRGFAQGMARRIFQGVKGADLKEFDGFGARYKKACDQVIDASAGKTVGAKDVLTDIWLVDWDKTTVHLIYPEQGLAGLVTTDRGEQDAYDAKGRRFRAFITDYQWAMGLAIEDPRRVIRIANVNVTALKKDPVAAVDLQTLMIRAQERIPDTLGAQAAWYLPSSITEALRLQILQTPRLVLTLDEVAGRRVETYAGVPVHRLAKEVIGTYTTKLNV